ncbi:MAG: single-stranded-DNA-specific exonuclease RecJ [Candidatus Fimenecus sp.]
MRRKQWCLSACDKDAAAQLAESGGFDPFLALLLTARGLTDETEAEAFLSSDMDFSDPFTLIDMEKAVDRIASAVENFERIAVFGDYDADGVTSTALLYSYLVSQGANVEYRIPDRMREGYGISCTAVRELSESGVSLIVTVDNGIAALQEAALAKELGVDMVITDHHTPGEVLPDAVAVVNPHRKDCPSEFKDFAGVGVAYQLVCALEGDCESVLQSYADLLAIGTLADVVPLVGENRALVKKGIRRINAGTRPGLEALKAVAGVADRPLTASNVAFTLAPRINAAGRIGSAETALQLLLCDNEQDAAELANETDSLNKQRQAIETKISAEAIRQIEETPAVKYASVLVVSGEGWHPGVIGIVAARLTSKYGKPAVVIATDGETGKGSCRSIPGFSVYDALKSCEVLLTHFGGHPGAAGLGIQTENIPALRDALHTFTKTAGLPFAQVHLDCKLNPAYINLTLLDTLSALEPCGCDNPVPTFGLYKLTLCAVKPVGEGKHLRLTLKKGAAEITAMLFSTVLGEFPYRIGDTVDLAVQIEKNAFRGEIRPSVHIKEMRFSDTDEENYLKSMRLYEKYRHGDPLSEKETAFLTPSREFLLGVYKFMKTAGKFPFDMEVFCKRSGCPYKNAATAAVSFDVLTELQLLTQDENGAYTCTEPKQKADLSASNILKTLSKEGA